MNFASIFSHEPTRQTFVPGDVLIRQGDGNDKLFIILEGEVEVRISGNKVATLKAGDLFGELSLLDKEPASGDVVGTVPGSFVTLDERRFVVVSQQNPFFTLALLRAVGAKLRAMNAGLAAS